MRKPLDEALSAVEDVDCSTTGLAEAATQWVAEWRSQRAMRSMIVDAGTRRLLAAGARITVANMRAYLSDVDRLREELQDAIEHADNAAQALEAA